MRRSLWLSVFLLGSGAVPGYAQSTVGAGDGSATNNPDLIRAGSNCTYNCGVVASSEPIDLYSPPIVMDQGDRLVPGPDYSATPLTQSLPGLNWVPYESEAPWFETDWSIQLRGSYIEGSRNTEALARVEPEFSLTHASRRGAFTLEAGAELDMDRNDTPRIGGFDLSASQVLALDPQSNVTFTGDLSVSQQSVNAVDVARNVRMTPLEVDGAASAGVDRRFGQLGISAVLDGSRYLISDTQLASGPQSNLDQKYWKGGGTLRAGYAVTPILTPFLEADAHYTLFDAAPSSTGIALDGWDYAFSAGLAADWQDVLSAEGSIGFGIRQFDDPSLSEVSSALYALDVTYAPMETVEVGAMVSTALNGGDPDNGQLASVTYSAAADLSYVLNSWLTLRCSINGALDEPQRGPRRTITYGGGVGADVALTDNSSLTFDYGYDESHTISQPIEHAHEFALGVMFSR